MGGKSNSFLPLIVDVRQTLGIDNWQPLFNIPFKSLKTNKLQLKWRGQSYYYIWASGVHFFSTNVLSLRGTCIIVWRTVSDAPQL